MSTELKEAISRVAKEKNISVSAILSGIEQSLLQACKNSFGTTDNVVVETNEETFDIHLFLNKTVVEQVSDDALEISLLDAKKIKDVYEIGDVVPVEIATNSFGRIATQNAKNVILQKMREEERRSVYEQFAAKEHDIVIGTLQRNGKHYYVNLGKVDALLPDQEMVRSERLRIGERIRVYVLEVKETVKGPKILVSRSHPDFVKKLFEREVTELQDGTVEIVSLAREAGFRTKMAVISNNEDVDPVGSCVGVNGTRVEAVVDELRGEKIDIITWDENPAVLIENALAPAKVVSVLADPEDKDALVIVPDAQLSLAIGREGQNARLSAKLTGFKIDIKSETQATEMGIFDEYFSDDDEEEDEEEGYEEPVEDDLSVEDEEALEDASTDDE